MDISLLITVILNVNFTKWNILLLSSYSMSVYITILVSFPPAAYGAGSLKTHPYVWLNAVKMDTWLTDEVGGFPWWSCGGIHYCHHRPFDMHYQVKRPLLSLIVLCSCKIGETNRWFRLHRSCQTLCPHKCRLWCCFAFFFFFLQGSAYTRSTATFLCDRRTCCPCPTWTLTLVSACRCL